MANTDSRWKGDKLWSVLTFGDSLTQGDEYNYQSFMADIIRAQGIKANIANHGIAGELVSEIVHRLKKALPADILTVMGGSNNALVFANSLTDAAEEIDAYIDREIVRKLSRAVRIARDFPPTRVILCSIPPIATLARNAYTSLIQLQEDKACHIIDKANRLIQALCKEEGVTFCDVNKAMRLDPTYESPARPEYVVEDGIHFTRTGYQACGEAIAGCCLRLMKRA